LTQSARIPIDSHGPVWDTDTFTGVPSSPPTNRSKKGKKSPEILRFQDFFGPSAEIRTQGLLNPMVCICDIFARKIRIAHVKPLIFITIQSIIFNLFDRVYRQNYRQIFGLPDHRKMLWEVSF
jgi:hypothetical protein